MDELGIKDARAAWRGDAFPTPRGWVHTLTAAMQDDIIVTAQAAAAANRAGRAQPLHAYALPTAKPLLDAAKYELEHGLGFAVLAGFPVDALDREETRLAYAGLCAHFGQAVVQNGRGERMVDVFDVGKDYSDQSRGYHGHALLPFHTDGTKGETDPVHYAALLCCETAASGGKSAIASGVTLYAAIRDRRPELLPALERGFHHHRQGDHPENHLPISRDRIPVFSFYDGYLRCRYNRNNAQWAERAGATLEEIERDALSTVDAVLSERGFALSMGREKGDLQIINNFTVLHSRSAYTDAPGTRRHLLRLWLSRRDSPRGGYDLIERFSGAESRFND